MEKYFDDYVAKNSSKTEVKILLSITEQLEELLTCVNGIKEMMKISNNVSIPNNGIKYTDCIYKCPICGATSGKNGKEFNKRSLNMHVVTCCKKG